jgi:ferric-dicitrate binding protein FerR (iron transport regulator)
MKSIACMRTWTLIDRRAQGLSSAEALRLEEHVERCEQCAAQLLLLDELRGLTAELPQALPPVQRERAIEGALAQAFAAKGVAGRIGALPARAALSARVAARPRSALQLSVGVALAAAAALLVIARPWSDGTQERASNGGAAAVDVARSGDRVLGGAVEIDGRPGGAGAALAAHVTLRATQAARVALAHGTLELAAGTTLRWDRDAHQVTLEHGSVTADVDPSARQRFRVQTRRFTVHVLGTRFTVDPSGVSVERGKVAVLAPDGAVLVPALTAGERFTAAEERAAAEPLDAADLLADADAAAQDDDEATAEAPRARDGRSRQKARALLAQARAQLAAGDTLTASGTVGEALASAGTRADRAEALSLRAECSLVAGDIERAIAGYLRVSRSFANLPAGQNALFAAARLRAERGQGAAAVTLLERYLDRYPRGRFVREARQRLVELD